MLLTAALVLTALAVPALLLDSRVALVGIYLTASFLGPALFLTFLAEASRAPDRATTLGLLFFGGGALTFAIVWTFQRQLVVAWPLGFGVGFPVLGFVALAAFVEEPVKLFVAACLTRGRATLLAGLLGGVAIGAGYAGFESVYFALTTPADVAATIGSLTLRGIFTPFGHPTWTAIVCAALRYGPVSTAGTSSVLAALGTSIGLHTLWNAPALAQSGLDRWLPGWWESGWAIVITTALSLELLAVGTVGLILLERAWRRAITGPGATAAGATLELAGAGVSAPLRRRVDVAAPASARSGAEPLGDG